MKTKEEILANYKDVKPKKYGDDWVEKTYPVGVVIKAMEEYANQDRWISVEERKPPMEGSYLCYDSYHRQIRCLVFNPHHDCWDDESGDDYYTDAIGGKVTHWQNLPHTPTPKE